MSFDSLVWIFIAKVNLTKIPGKIPGEDPTYWSEWWSYLKRPIDNETTMIERATPLQYNQEHLLRQSVFMILIV